MAPRTKKRVGDAPPHGAATSSTPSQSLFARIASPLGVSALALGLIALLWVPNILAAWRTLEKRPEYQLKWSQIHITQQPNWVPGKLVPDVMKARDFPESIASLDSELTREIAEAFSTNPWVEEVISVRKSYPARVDVELRYRRPIARVAINSGEFSIDAEGVVLPLPRGIREDAEKYPLITGVKSAPGLVGKPWGDQMVYHGAAVAAVLEPHWVKLQLTEIVVPKTAPRADSLDDGVFEIRSKDGSRILWGHPPGSDHPGALPTEQKLGRLLEYSERLGPFGPQHAPHLIDLRPLAEISRKRLNGD